MAVVIRGTGIVGIEIEEVTQWIEEEIQRVLASQMAEPFWVTHYGANDIHHRHLVYWIVVRTDQEMARLDQDAELMKLLRGLLVASDYPVEGRDGVPIGFESHETVDRVTNGDFSMYWK
ncbi:MAG TPA: hypothetical protein DDY91_15450 [Planctomycetaceae bacterium]|nr:hypothetical protein [Planctomycetaceae bacterium]